MKEWETDRRHLQIAEEAIRNHNRGNLFIEVYDCIANKGYTNEDLESLIESVGFTPSEFKDTVGGSWSILENTLNRVRGTWRSQIMTEQEGRRFMQLLEGKLDPSEPEVTIEIPPEDPLDFGDINRRIEISSAGGYLTGFYMLQNEEEWKSAIKKLDELFPENPRPIRLLLYSTLVEALIMEKTVRYEEKVGDFAIARKISHPPKPSKEEWLEERKREWISKSDVENES